MRLEIFILGVTAFFIFNAYSDGKYTKMIWAFKKYYTMIFYAVLGIGVYMLLKQNPQRGRNMLMCANNFVKFMPIDRNSMDLLSPIIDFTKSNEPAAAPSSGGPGFMESLNGFILQTPPGGQCMTGGATKRSVSETKKKYVAANQGWKCGSCQQQLDHTYEIDHKIRLEYGGGNDVGNLIALCRNCHGRKTASENM